MPDFQLDGETIIGRLHEMVFNGQVEAEIPAAKMRELVSVRETGRIQLAFRKGEIIACLLKTVRSQQSVPMNQVIPLLNSIGVLRWQLYANTQQTDPLLPVTPLPACCDCSDAKLNSISHT